jgi:hypothetical protein
MKIDNFETKLPATAAPNRFPLTAETHSFKPIADYLHAKGLKFGLHLMRGIPRQAVDRDNAPLTNWTRLLTNQFDGNGNFNFTNPLDPGSAQSFDLLQLP